MKPVYTIDRVNSEELKKYDFAKYMLDQLPLFKEKFTGDFNLDNMTNEGAHHLLDGKMFFICRRDGEITGHLICEIYTHPFDQDLRVLQQISLWVKPDSGRTAYHLFQKFIDIGKCEADHIYTMLTSETNIKPSTLERMGFKYAETVYRMEIK